MTGPEWSTDLELEWRVSDDTEKTNELVPHALQRCPAATSSFTGSVLVAGAAFYRASAPCSSACWRCCQLLDAYVQQPLSRLSAAVELVVQ